jgi:glycosyltransferase involved in cell wall biosynthesis
MIVGFNQILSFKGMTGGVRRERVLLPVVIRNLMDRGVQSVVFIASDCAYAEAAEWLKGSGVHQIVQTRIPSNSTWKRVLYSKLLFSGYLKKYGVNLFVDLYYPLASSRTKTCFTVHDLRFITQPETYSRFRLMFLRALVPFTLKRVDRIVAVSEFTKQDIVENGWADPSKITVIHNSFDAGALMREEVMLPADVDQFLDGRDYFLCVGHLEPRKNLKRIIRAYSRYRSRDGRNFALVIVGKANAAFTTLIEDALVGTEYAKDVLVTGFVEDRYLPTLYKQSKLFLFPSLHEGFGIPVLEAMAAGTPVLTSNSSALPEVAGGSALLVDPESIEEIERGIYRIMSDSEYSRELVDHGYDNLRRFRCDILAGKIASMLYQLASEGES